MPPFAAAPARTPRPALHAMSQTLHPMLNIAIKAARAAGAIINRAALDIERVQVTAKSHNDFVTEVDSAAEMAIIETLLQAYPGHGILAEESGRTHGARDSEYVWIIDPLDGTTNFIHGFPVYAVSIALAFRGQVQQAVVYDPARNDLFYASKGKGAYLNDRRLRVSKRSRMLEALIGTGFPFRKGDNFKRYLKIFEDVMQVCAGLRRPGAAALDLCYVAAGWYDGFFETGLNPWDVAAGSLIITEAGGLVGNFTGEADFLHQRELVAGNPRIYAQLVQILAPYTRVIKDEPAEAASGPAQATRPAAKPAVKPRATPRKPAADVDPEAATLAFLQPIGADYVEAPPPAPVEAPAPAAPRPPVRIRKADLPAAPPPREVAERRPRPPAAPFVPSEHSLAKAAAEAAFAPVEPPQDEAAPAAWAEAPESEAGFEMPDAPSTEAPQRDATGSGTEPEGEPPRRPDEDAPF